MFDEESGMRKEREQLLSRVRVTRAFQQRFCFFCCHKCHTWCEIGEKAGRKKRQKRRSRKSVFLFSLLEIWISGLVSC